MQLATKSHSDRVTDSARNSFRATVLWAVALLFLVGGLLAYLLSASYQRYLATAGEISQSLALSTETFLFSHFQAIDLALQSANERYLQLLGQGSFDPEAFTRYLQSLRQRIPEAVSVRGTDRGGVVRYGDGIDPRNLQTSNDRDHFKRAREERRLVFGVPVISRLTGEYLFPIVMPLSARDGSFDGITIVNTKVSRLADVFASVRMGQHGVVTLVDDKMQVLVRFPAPPNSQPGQTLVLSAPQTRAVVAAGKTQDLFRARSQVDLQWRTLTVRRIGHYPVYVIVGLADADILAPWWREVTVGLGFFAALCLLVAAFCRNIHHRWQAELKVEAMHATQRAHDRLRAVVAAIPDSVLEVDRAGRCTGVPTGRDVNFITGGIAPEGRNVLDLLPAEVSEQVRAALDQAAATGLAQGTQIAIPGPACPQWFELSVARMNESSPQEGGGLIVVSRDVTERVQAQAQVEQLAFSDLLTRLPNRRLFMDRLRQSMASSQRSGKIGAVLFLDLDRFKVVNDTLGHQYGDLLLVQTAQRLRSIMREEDTVARLGGDEFVIILEQLSTSPGEAASQAMQVASKIVYDLQSTYDLDGRNFDSTVSVGVTLFQGHEHTMEELLKRADTSMYQAKSAGRNAVRFFDPQTQAGIEARVALEAALRQAVVREEFVLYYQPQVNQSGRCIGAEALIRWRSPERGFVSPADFIPLAEETGLISPIGHWVVAEACRRLVAWQTDPALRELTLAVNVSARQFAHPTFVTEVSDLVAHHGVDPRRLKLELTESMLISGLDDVIARMEELNALGIDFALDDFGTGFSSLAYLKRLPLAQVKIDRSFTDDILHDPYDNAICKAIVALSRTMELEAIAEGIETPEQWVYLRELGCLHGQGYLFGRPMPGEDFAQWLREGRHIVAA